MKKRVKAGASKDATVQRKALFVEAFIANGGNGKQAAITAGYSAKTAEQQASRLLRHVKVAGEVARRRSVVLAKAETVTGLSMERTLREVARVGYFDGRKLYNADGGLKEPKDWDDDTAAAISHMGRNGPVPFDKNAALEKAMKHHGLYEKDNSQVAPTIPPIFNIIGVPGRDERGRAGRS